MNHLQLLDYCNGRGARFQIESEPWPVGQLQLAILGDAGLLEQLGNALRLAGELFGEFVREDRFGIRAVCVQTRK